MQDRTRRIGQALNAAVVRTPWLWPLLRGPMSRFFDERAQGWDDLTDAGGVEHLEGLAVALTHVKPAPERALDIGTGTGVAALLVSREFPTARVRGVDISPEMISLAQSKVGLDPEGRIAFKVADASKLPWQEDSFDLVTQVNVPPFFGEIARVLRPGGFVIATASSGADTPFYTSFEDLRRGFAKREISEVISGAAGRGTYWVGRRAA